jgi:DNA-binding MarR family transcriptional regulator
VSKPSRPSRISFLLSQLGAFGATQFADRVADLGLSAGEAGVLRLLARNPAISQRALATRLGAVPSRVVVLIDALEGRGLVSRQRSATDRRNHELRLTEIGTDLLGRLREVAEHHEKELFEPLTAAERRELGILLAKLAQGHGLDPDVHPGHATS